MIDLVFWSLVFSSVPLVVVWENYRAHNPPASSLSIAEQIRQETVLIDDGDNGHGSGVVVKKLGTVYIWTAGHCVVEGKIPTVTTADGKTHKAKVIASDLVGDLALLVPEDQKDFHSFANFNLTLKTPDIGTHVWHCGNFLGLQFPFSISEGVVSAINRDQPAVPEDPLTALFVAPSKARINLDQTTAPCFPGSSGGGIFLDDGTCIGLAERQFSSSLTLFIPAREMANWAEAKGVLGMLVPEWLEEAKSQKDFRIFNW